MDSPDRSRATELLAGSNLARDVLPAPRDWGLLTSMCGCMVAHHVAHLTWGNQRASLAVQCPAERVLVAGSCRIELSERIDAAASRGATRRPALVRTWRAGQYRLGCELISARTAERLQRSGALCDRDVVTRARLSEVRAHVAIIARTLSREFDGELTSDRRSGGCRAARFGYACGGAGRRFGCRNRPGGTR